MILDFLIFFNPISHSFNEHQKIIALRQHAYAIYDFFCCKTDNFRMNIVTILSKAAVIKFQHASQLPRKVLAVSFDHGVWTFVP